VVLSVIKKGNTTCPDLSGELHGGNTESHRGIFANKIPEALPAPAPCNQLKVFDNQTERPEKITREILKNYTGNFSKLYGKYFHIVRLVLRYLPNERKKRRNFQGR